MRSRRAVTISLPPEMLKQMEKVRKAEHRTTSELVRDAWRTYFAMRHAPVYPHGPRSAPSNAAGPRSAAATSSPSTNSMPTWTVTLTGPAQKALHRAPRHDQERLRAALRELAADPRSGDFQPLKNQIE